MSRRNRAQKRKVLPDSRYNNALVGQLINVVMERGKKALAERIVYKAIERVSENLSKGDPIDLLLGVLENIRPRVEVKSRRVGGATYQIPMEINYEQQLSIAFRWLVNTAEGQKGVPMSEALAKEMLDAYNNTGSVVKKKEETHRMAQANRAFAHLKW